MLLGIVGPTNGGKTTIAEKVILLDNPNITTRLFKTCTTRQRRVTETEANPLTSYHFLTREEFIKAINNNEFFEYYELDKGTHFDFYGTKLKDLQEAIESEDLYVIVLDPIGAQKIKSLFPSMKVLFLTPPSITELFRRAIDRGTDPIETVLARVYRSEMEELPLQDAFDYKVLNDNLDECFAKVVEIINENFIKPKKNQKSN